MACIVHPVIRLYNLFCISMIRRNNNTNISCLSSDRSLLLGISLTSQPVDFMIDGGSAYGIVNGITIFCCQRSWRVTAGVFGSLVIGWFGQFWFICLYIVNLWRWLRLHSRTLHPQVKARRTESVATSMKLALVLCPNLGEDSTMSRPHSNKPSHVDTKPQYGEFDSLYTF